MEGFNLRRDVYIRLAVFVQQLKQSGVRTYGDVKLVLPPFTELYHWRNRGLDQKHVFWNQFFELDSLKLYADVLDMWEFFEAVGVPPGQDIVLDEVYKLKHFQDMFENGVFVDKFAKAKCGPTETNTHDLLQYANLTTKRVTCLHFQGSASLLADVLDKFKPK